MYWCQMWKLDTPSIASWMFWWVTTAFFLFAFLIRCFSILFVLAFMHFIYLTLISLFVIFYLIIFVEMLYFWLFYEHPNFDNQVLGSLVTAPTAASGVWVTWYFVIKLLSTVCSNQEYSCWLSSYSDSHVGNIHLILTWIIVIFRISMFWRQQEWIDCLNLWTHDQW